MPKQYPPRKRLGPKVISLLTSWWRKFSSFRSRSEIDWARLFLTELLLPTLRRKKLMEEKEETHLEINSTGIFLYEENKSINPNVNVKSPCQTLSFVSKLLWCMNWITTFDNILNDRSNLNKKKRLFTYYHFQVANIFIINWMSMKFRRRKYCIKVNLKYVVQIHKCPSPCRPTQNTWSPT